MRAVIQRVTKASVIVNEVTTGKIEKGLVVFLGVGKDDIVDDVEYVAKKVAMLRIFEDTEGLMNYSVIDVGGAVLCVSQFTLYGDCRKGRRPGFSAAAGYKVANRLYSCFLDQLTGFNIPVESGIFQADMSVRIENDGPVTMLIDSKKNF